MGSVLVGARFTERRNGIYYKSFDAIQIDSYLTMRNKSAKALVSEALLSARAYAQVVR